jgi:hypothetical protein
MKAKKNLIIVGDRVLIDPDEGARALFLAFVFPKV